MQEKYVIKNSSGLYIGNLLIADDVTFVMKVELAKTFVTEGAANEFVEQKGLTDVSVKKITVTMIINEV
ncbi:hypothetical protein F157LOC_00799 [Pectobacterium brasiliense]|uniref:hypothetical protein n=1 Tax=Pectobacterium brasiliense TaxID=180957 RepID=UPI000CE68CC0|nr:hypothetical protein [Pectobacterium brasiliense]PPE61965.1 hypothetical protein F157LOC_00799 [Pectobacterium brasiliense]